MRTGTDMKKQKFLSAIAAGAILASSGAAQAPVPSVPAPVEAEAAAVSFAPVTRVITLDELGFDNGFEIEGLSGGSTLYLVPAGWRRRPAPHAALSCGFVVREPAFDRDRDWRPDAIHRRVARGPFGRRDRIPVDPALAQDGSGTVSCIRGQSPRTAASISACREPISHSLARVGCARDCKGQVSAVFPRSLRSCPQRLIYRCPRKRARHSWQPR